MIPRPSDLSEASNPTGVYSGSCKIYRHECAESVLEVHVAVATSLAYLRTGTADAAGKLHTTRPTSTLS